MKRVLLRFLSSFAFTFAILYWASDGILAYREKPPIEIFESKEEEDTMMEAKIAKHKIPVSSQHKILGGRYYSYDEKTSLVDFEIRFMEMLPLDSHHVLLKSLECIHYYREKKAEYEHTPQRFVIRSEQGKLELGKDNQKIESLFLEKDVEIQGYESLEAEKDPDVKEESLLLLRTEQLRVFFQDKKLETKERVWLRWKNSQAKEIFFLEGIGLKGDMNLNQILFLSNVKTKIVAEIFEQKNKKKMAIEEIESLSQGRAFLEYSREKKVFRLEQEEKVMIQANQAKLFCDRIAFDLQRKEDSRLQIQRIEAFGNVKFEDKNEGVENSIKSGYFLLESPSPEESHLVFRENPEITILDIQSFSILDEESKEKLKKEARRHRLKTLYIRCKDRIEIHKKNKDKNSIEEYFFYDDVVLKETSEKIPFLELHSRKAELVVLIQESDKNRRVPQFFKAYQDVVILHERGKAKGEFFHWKSLSKDESRLELKGNPFLLIQNIAENKVTTGFSSLASEKEQKNSSAKNTEDIEVVSSDPMHLRMLKENKQRILTYKTQNNILVTRYAGNTKEVLGKFSCQKLLLNVTPNSKTKKMEVSYLKAQEKIWWDSKEAKGSAQELVYKEFQGENVLTLSQDVVTQTQEGKMSAQILHYYTGREILEAIGNPVMLESKEIHATGKELRYFKKQDCLEIQGKPAHIWQPDGKGNRIHAPYVTYWRQTEKVSATKGVELTFATSGKDLAFLQGLDKSNSSESSKEKPAKYILKTTEIHAELDTKGKSLRSFETQGDVLIQKAPEDQKIQPLEARGKQLLYRSQQGVLYGEPAEIHYDGNTITSKEFLFSTLKKEILCQGPTKITIAHTNTQFQGLEKSQSTQPLEIFTKGSVLYNQEKKEIQWQEDVLVKRQEDTLKCQKMTAVLEDNKITTLVAYHNVEISSQGSIAIADQMRWNEKSDQAFLIAHPFVEIRSKDFVMKAPIVWYHIKERRFFTQGKDIQIESIPSSKQ
ncbi:MAG: LPS export ABC transporter periplasmic protein LptC [Candidatus Brocadiae bacterium]|nr:LPS export ABC transporter periplasmic protein LptC [Candidatus Brocadiia bacterium]